MKKFVAIFITLSLFLLTSIPSFSYNEKSVDLGKIYFEKNFDDEFFGENLPFDNLTIKANGNIITTEVKEDGNRYMLFEKHSPDYDYGTDSGSSSIYKVLSNAVNEEKMVLQFDVMPKEPATKLMVTISQDSSTSTSFSLEGNKLSLSDNEVLPYGEWKTVRAVFDFSGDKSYMTVYADNEEITKKEINIAAFWRVRFVCEKTNAAGKFCFDNFLIYSGDPIFDDTVYNLDYKSIVPADNDSIGNISAISTYGEYIVGGIKGVDSELIKCENDEIFISYKKLGALYGEQIEDELYLPYDDALLKFEKTAVFDDRGFVYWNNDGGAAELSDDQKWIVHNALMYERPESSYLTENVKSGHPRLSIPEGRIEEIKEEIKNNEHAKWYYDESIKRINEYYNRKLLNDPSDERSIMMKARDLLTRVQNLALWYYLMEDNSATNAKEYQIKENVKNKIWQNIEAVINDEDFPHWQPNSGLDNAEMATTVAYAYDWLYNEWTEEQKMQIEEALYKKALVYAEKNYEGQIGSSISWWVDAPNSNQNAVINGGYILCAISIMDKYPETAGYVLEKAIRSIESFQNSLYPSGAWLEGTTYWTYSMKYWVPAISSLKISYGKDFGLTRAPGLEKSPEYIMHTASLNQNNNYHDSELSNPVYNMGRFYDLANLYNEPSWADWMLTYDRHHGISHGLPMLISFPSSTAKVLSDINLPKDIAIKGDEVGAFREKWLDENSMYLSFHGGKAFPGHGHCDTGTFVYEYDGVRFAIDLPSESYSFSGDERLNTYRVRAEGHNCLVINPDDDPGHITNAFSPIEKFETNDYGGFAILNMSEAYAEDATTVKRGFKTNDNRNSMTIRDEIEGIIADGEVYWFMHTDATTDIAINEKTAILTNSGKSIKVEFLTDAQNFEVKVMDAAPLSTSPNPTGQTNNAAYKKLAFRADCVAGDNIYIQAKLSPVAEDIVSAEDTSLSQWKNDSLVEIYDYEDGEIRAEIGAKDLFSFIALYKGDELYRFLPAENNTYDGMTVKTKLSSEENISAKLFVWRDRKTLVPLMETTPIN